MWAIYSSSETVFAYDISQKGMEEIKLIWLLVNCNSFLFSLTPPSGPVPLSHAFFFGPNNPTGLSRSLEPQYYLSSQVQPSPKGLWELGFCLLLVFLLLNLSQIQWIPNPMLVILSLGWICNRMRNHLIVKFGIIKSILVAMEHS